MCDVLMGNSVFTLHAGTLAFINQELVNRMERVRLIVATHPKRDRPYWLRNAGLHMPFFDVHKDFKYTFELPVFECYTSGTPRTESAKTPCIRVRASCWYEHGESYGDDGEELSEAFVVPLWAFEDTWEPRFIRETLECRAEEDRQRKSEGLWEYARLKRELEGVEVDMPELRKRLGLC